MKVIDGANEMLSSQLNSVSGCQGLLLCHILTTDCFTDHRALLGEGGNIYMCVWGVCVTSHA